MAYLYKQSIDHLVDVPKRFLRLMIEHSERLTAKQQILNSAVAMYPHLSQESQEQQMGIWERISQLVGMARSALEQVIWEGTLPDDLPANMVVAEDWDTVVGFFTKTGAIGAGG